MKFNFGKRVLLFGIAYGLLCLSALAAHAEDKKEEKPPVLPPMKPLFDFPVRDTSICVGPDKTYYLTGTTGHPTWWKTNDGIRIWKSADLKTWEPLGYVWKISDGTWQKEKHGDSRALWAPELHYIKKTYWLTFCMNYGGTGLLKSTTGKAEGPYEDVHPKGPLTTEIDASLFADDDGTVYFVWQNGKIARLTDDMTKLAEKPHLLKPANAEQVGFEGAFLTKINGKYTLICAEFNGENYDCMAATAEKIDGPFSDRYLAIPYGGHNMIFKDVEGKWQSTFFGNNKNAPFCERPGLLQIDIDKDGRIKPKMP